MSISSAPASPVSSDSDACPPAARVQYLIRHDTLYRYDQSVGESRQLLRLTPRLLPWQNCLAQHLQIEPEPEFLASHLDGFGNPVQVLQLEQDHESLFIRVETRIEIFPRTQPRLSESPSWETVRDTLAYHGGQVPEGNTLEACSYLFESNHVRVKREFAAWAEQDFLPGTPILVGVDQLMHRIYNEFTFDPEATDVSTPVTEVFEHRRGVCQDFAHLMLSCLRSLGLAARYVSGYLLTRPPPGKPRLIGADATHAWISVFCPRYGWVDFDPTNALQPALEHITLAWGRDFSDVSPLCGVILGGGGHEPEIAVTVAPHTEIDDLFPDSPLRIDLHPAQT